MNIPDILVTSKQVNQITGMDASVLRGLVLRKLVVPKESIKLGKRKRAHYFDFVNLFQIMVYSIFNTALVEYNAIEDFQRNLDFTEIIKSQKILFLSYSDIEIIPDRTKMFLKNHKNPTAKILAQNLSDYESKFLGGFGRTDLFKKDGLEKIVKPAFGVFIINTIKICSYLNKKIEENHIEKK